MPIIESSRAVRLESIAADVMEAANTKWKTPTEAERCHLHRAAIILRNLAKEDRKEQGVVTK